MGVEAGGNQRPEFWRHPAEGHGAVLDWETLMARLVDSTGQSGPATSTMCTCPEGTADQPVEGVSWYEAAAYAEFAGKSLPTVFHWWRAAGFGGVQAPNFSDILAASNFSGRGARPAVLDWGHLPPGYATVVRELIAWTDQWLGPVPLSGSAAVQNSQPDPSARISLNASKTSAAR